LEKHIDYDYDNIQLTPHRDFSVSAITSGVVSGVVRLPILPTISLDYLFLQQL
jgi:hypothetical protein